jgi:hypothetical protein
MGGGDSMDWVHEWTIPAERPPLVGEVSANFCRQRVPRGQCVGSQRPYSQISRPEPLLFLSSTSSIGPCSRRGSARIRTPDLWICNQELWPLGHRGILLYTSRPYYFPWILKEFQLLIPVRGIPMYTRISAYSDTVITNNTIDYSLSILTCNWLLMGLGLVIGFNADSYNLWIHFTDNYHT